MVFGLWTRFSDSDCKRSRPRNDNKLLRNSSGSLELVVVSKTTVLEQPSSASSSYPQPARNTWNEGRSTSKRRWTGYGTSGYLISSADLDDVEFYWENDQLDVDAVFIPGIDTPFSQKAFDDLEIGGSAENPILLDKEEDMENSPVPPKTPVSERPTRPPALLASRPLGTRIKCSWLFFIEICFNRYYRVCVLKQILKNVFHFIITFPKK